MKYQMQLKKNCQKWSLLKKTTSISITRNFNVPNNFFEGCRYNFRERFFS